MGDDVLHDIVQDAALAQQSLLRTVDISLPKTPARRPRKKFPPLTTSSSIWPTCMTAARRRPMPSA